jgi:hypothetical protein
MKLEESAVMNLAGGILGNGYQCGTLWGAALAAGAQAHRLYGSGAQAEAQTVTAAQRLVVAFRSRNRTLNCAEITNLKWKGSPEGQMGSQILKFFLRGGPILCFRLTASYARATFQEINATFAESLPEAPPPPVSCASWLVREMGETEQHAVMAAGLAGGIGLSGGACGALGAALWITSFRQKQAGLSQALFDDPESQAVIDRFLECSAGAFECAQIAGRKFADVNEHASYLREGGCAMIIKALAGQNT